MHPLIAGPLTLALIYRAHSHRSLTPAGLVAAAATAIAHAVHPWNTPFALLVVFFLVGTKVTKVKHEVKARLTMSASGSAGGEGPRTHIQVLANSAVASVLSLLHAYQLHRRAASADPSSSTCFAFPGDLLPIGIIANYAAVAADTFSSELGILSSRWPRLITSIRLRTVPPGTNGGVSPWGLCAGFIGSAIMVVTAVILSPFCRAPNSAAAVWTLSDQLYFATAMIVWGGLGSVLDSLLGGWFQSSIIDTRTGRVVEAAGGKRVLISKGDSAQRPASSSDRSRTSPSGHDRASRIVESGALGLLDNNDVNFLMALMMSVGAMFVASRVYNVPMTSIWSA